MNISVTLSEWENMCGGCQRWGVSPDLVDDFCDTCGRGKLQIYSDHSVVDLSNEQQKFIKKHYLG